MRPCVKIFISTYTGFNYNASLMNRFNFLYFVTTVTAIGTAAMGGHFLIRSGLPTADVLADFDHNHPLIRIADFEPGDARIIKINQFPVIVWRRDFDDIVLAKQHEDPALWPDPFSVLSGKTEPFPAQDTNLMVNDEWFFAWALNPSGFGCVVLTRAGDFDGFFDPCRGAHFDLSGRIRKGPSRGNLRIISAQMTEDGRYLQLDLTNPPKTRR